MYVACMYLVKLRQAKFAETNVHVLHEGQKLQSK